MRKKQRGGSLNMNYSSFGLGILTSICIGILIILGYILYIIGPNISTDNRSNQEKTINVLANFGSEQSSGIFTNPYKPPLKTDHLSLPLTMNLPDAVKYNWPIMNYPTRGFNGPFSQVGILTKEHSSNNGEELILPLMGRRLTSSNDKLQYYAISNTGAVNTKLPIRKNGRSCTGEYGCEELYNQDIVHVEGYNKPFKATLYENATFAYVPI